MSLEKKVDQQAYEIQEIKSSVSQLIEAVKEQTKSSMELNKTLIEYTTKHDITQKDLQVFKDEYREDQQEYRKVQEEQNKKISTHGEKISEMKPVTDSVRGIAWKMVGTFVISTSGVAAIVAAISKAG